MRATSGLNSAEQCRELGIQVGDTLKAREEKGDWWHEMRITLTTIDRAITMWMFSERSKTIPEWTQPVIQSSWLLNFRDWHKVNE